MGIKSSGLGRNHSLEPGNVRLVSSSLERILQHQVSIQNSLPISSSWLQVRAWEGQNPSSLAFHKLFHLTQKVLGCSETMSFYKHVAFVFNLSWDFL